MPNIIELIEKLCPDGVEFQELSNKELFKFYYGKGNKIPEDIGGIYDVYGANGVVSHINEYNCEDVSIIGHIGAVGMVNRCKGKCFVTYNGTIAEVVDKTKVNSQYLYYVLTTLNLPSYKKGSQPFLSVSDFEKIKIAVPPLEVQDEIVQVLDDFTCVAEKLSLELSAELKTRQKQYEYYKNKFFDFDNSIKRIELGDLCDIVTKQTGFDYTKTIKDSLVRENKEGTIPYIQTKFFTGKNFEYNTDYYIPINIANQFPKIMLDNQAILLSIVGASIGNVGLFNGDKKCFLGGAICIAKVCNKYNIDYIYYYLTSYFGQKQIFNKVKGAGQATVTIEDIRKFLIPMPSIETQEKIVDSLNKLDQMSNDIIKGLTAEIEARQKQYEYYRDKLLTFKELKVNEG